MTIAIVYHYLLWRSNNVSTDIVLELTLSDAILIQQVMAFDCNNSSSRQACQIL